MSIWATITGLFTGKTVEKVADIADEAFYTEQEVAQDDASDTANARSFQPGTKFNDFIDKWSRLIRPITTTWLFGGLAGLWPLPQATNIDPEMWKLIVTVFIFWFGGRAIVRDIPKMIGVILSMRSKLK